MHLLHLAFPDREALILPAASTSSATQLSHTSQLFRAEPSEIWDPYERCCDVHLEEGYACMA